HGRVPPGPVAAALGPLPGLGLMAPPYLYPPPLFGRYDDPFYGFEPPVISYPPWWGAITTQRLDPALAAEPAPVLEAPATATSPPSESLPAGTVEMTIDPRGVAVLRGTVSSLAERVAIGQQIAQT